MVAILVGFLGGSFLKFDLSGEVKKKKGDLRFWIASDSLRVSILILLFKMDYIYTIFLLAAFHTPPVLLGGDVSSGRERHSSSFFSSYSYSFT